MVQVEVLDQKGGATNPCLYVNGKRISGGGTRDLAKNVITFKVNGIQGLNRLRATAFNADGSVESSGDEMAVLCTAPSTAKPVLYVCAIGVDRYKCGMKLHYAVKDARSVAGYFKPGFFADVQTRILLDEKADKQGIVNTLAEIARAARSQDTLLLYLAGHGATIGDTFYFLPYDVQAGTELELQTTGLSSVELGQCLADIPATRQALVLDACQSGSTTTALGKMLFSKDAVGLVRSQQKLARSSGTFLIAASTADQYAVEVPELGHGVLTYALLAGLGQGKKPAAPLNTQGEVTVNSLLRYLTDEVPRLSEKYHGFRQEIVQFSTGQDFSLAKGK
jgi:hypothetical protein